MIWSLISIVFFVTPIFASKPIIYNFREQTKENLKRCIKFFVSISYDSAEMQYFFSRFATRAAIYFHQLSSLTELALRDEATTFIQSLQFEDDYDLVQGLTWSDLEEFLVEALRECSDEKFEPLFSEECGESWDPSRTTTATPETATTTDSSITRATIESSTKEKKEKSSRRNIFGKAVRNRIRDTSPIKRLEDMLSGKNGSPEESTFFDKSLGSILAHHLPSHS